MKISNSNEIIAKFKDLLKGATWRSKLLSDKFCSVLEEIPELISFINEDNYENTKLILEEISQNMEIKEYKSGNYVRRILGNNDDFYMILSGSVLELEIKYICTTMTFKEFVLFLTKLYLLNENHLYNDCLEKNKDMFPFKTFKNYVKNLKNKNKPENEKNSFDESKLNNNKIDIISICKDINVKNFNYKEELKELKRNIKNSAWYRRKKYLDDPNIDNNVIINNFLNLYNINLDNINNNFLINETKYNVYLPYYINKKILEPISFIGNLARPQKMKSYIGYICLKDCFIIYLDKNVLKPNQPIYRFSNKETNNSMIDNLFLNHFLFKNIEKDFLNKNFGKYFKMLYLKKNDILFKQDEPHKGIYIITKGLFQIKSIKSYNELNNLNFILLHSLDNFPQYITNIKNEHIDNNVNFSNKKNYLKGYYDYNSDTNLIMKNPMFAEKAKEKDDIYFCIYGENDILGMAEVYNTKNRINIFTAKCISDEAELFFLPNEIFNGLISNENIYKRCALIIEQKVHMLTRCISKYRNIFEKKIEYMINNNIDDNQKTKLLVRNTLSAKNRPIKEYNTIVSKISNPINKLYKSSSEVQTLNEKDIKTKLYRNEIDKNINSNSNTIFEKLNEDKNSNLGDINSLKKSEVEEKNIIDLNQNNKFILKKKILISPNNQNKNKIKNYYNLMITSPKTDKKKLLNENRIIGKNSPKFLTNKKLKNQLLKSSSSLLNDDAGIKKRMEEISRFYSGFKKRNSGPVIISYMGNNSLNNFEDKKKNINTDEEKKLKLKLKKGLEHKMKGRCLSAQRYDENDIKGLLKIDNNFYKKTFEYSKNSKDIQKYYNNIRGLSSQKRNIFSAKSNSKIRHNIKPSKIIINRFVQTSLFPNINQKNEK